MRTNYRGVFTPQTIAELQASRDSGAAIAALNDGSDAPAGSGGGGSILVPALILAFFLAAA